MPYTSCRPGLFAIFFPVLLLVAACTGSAPPAPVAESRTTDTMTVEAKQPPVATWSIPRDLPKVPRFPGVPFHRVTAFELNGRAARPYPESVFYSQTGKSVDLDTGQIDYFLKLINNPKSYGMEEKSCFDPRVGLVFYDTANATVAYMSICLDCHNMRSMPPLDLGLEPVLRTGFNTAALQRLEEFFTRFEMDVKGRAANN